ncbi:MAG TPA: hypothetical protein VNA30_05405 [Mycobacteriales bacterium]|nr:hypothetical protein [Mycobacteriales bacterium]
MRLSRLAVVTVATTGAVLASAPSASAGPEYVKVTNQDGVITVSTQIPRQPLASASVNTRTGEVCMGFSYQMPFCRTVPLVDAIAIEDPFQGTPPVVVDADASDGSVGVGTQLYGQPLLGARYSTTTGELCLGFSYQVPQCVGGIS